MEMPVQQKVFAGHGSPANCRCGLLECVLSFLLEAIVGPGSEVWPTTKEGCMQQELPDRGLSTRGIINGHALRNTNHIVRRWVPPEQRIVELGYSGN